MSQPIYVIVVMKRGTERRDRTWGWYFNFDDAERVVLNNWSDIFEENYYNIALIEKHEEGVCAHTEDVAWYLADYKNVPQEPNLIWQPKVRRIEKPEWAKGMCGWGMG